MLNLSNANKNKNKKIYKYQRFHYYNKLNIVKIKRQLTQANAIYNLISHSLKTIKN